jgi:cytochrome c553
MSLAEIEQAVDKLSREELATLAAYIARQDKLGWDEQIEEDFSPGGKHAAGLQRIDAEIDAGDFRPMP